MADLVIASTARRMRGLAFSIALSLAAGLACAARAEAAASAPGSDAVASATETKTATASPSAPADAGASASEATQFVAPTAVPSAADPALEARMLAITNELRCLVCQNQTIAESHADLAVDLRQEVRELLERGQDEAQIRHYMTDRYGDFILYRPPFKATTLVLWLGPAVLMAIAVISLIVVISRRRRLADDRFEPDPVWPDGPLDERDRLDAARSSPDTPARPGAPA